MKIVFRWKSQGVRVVTYMVVVALLVLAGISNYAFVYQGY